MISILISSLFVFAATTDYVQVVNDRLLQSDQVLAAYVDAFEKKSGGECRIDREFTYTYPFEESVFSGSSIGFTTNVLCGRTGQGYRIYIKGDYVNDGSLRHTEIMVYPH